MSRRVLAAAAGLLLAAAVASADRDSAKFFEERGDKSFAAKQYADAEAHYRKALVEDATYHPARYGLANALAAEDKRDEAIAELRRVVADIKATPDPLPPGWTEVRGKAEKRLEQLDAAGTELRGIVEVQVAALLQTARKWAKTDAETAIKACRLALAIRPGDPKATELIESLGASPKGEPIPLFDGENLDGWADVGRAWSVQDGAMSGIAKDCALIARTEKWIEGDFDLRAEMKLAEDLPGATLFGLAPCSDGKESHYTLAWFDGRVLLQEDFGGDPKDRVAYDQPPPSECAWKKDDWNLYEIQFRKAEVRIAVNGHQVFAEPRPAARKGGFVALKVQDCRALFRRVEYVPR